VTSDAGGNVGDSNDAREQSPSVINIVSIMVAVAKIIIMTLPSI
jgi:hypothetical protein